MMRSTISVRTPAIAWLAGAAVILLTIGCPTEGTLGPEDGVPRIEVVPAAIDFGVVELGSLEERALEIANTGDGPLEVQSVVLVDGGGPFTVPAFSGDLEGGAAVTLTVSMQAGDVGPAADTIRIQSDDPEQPLVEVALVLEDVTVDEVPGIEWTPASLTWDELPLGEAEIKTVTVTSVGTGDLAIDGVELSAESSADFSLAAGDVPDSLAPGESFTVDVEFAPSDEGQDEGALLLHSDDPETPEATIPLSGGLLPQPDIEIIPDALDFGSMDVGLSASDSAVIHNLGQLDLSLGNLYLTGSTDFSLEIDPSTDVLGPGEIAHIQIGWNPTVAGMAYGTIYVPSDDPDESVVVITLEGEALPLGEIEVSPLAVDFGVVEVGDSVTVAVTVTNVGSADLTIGGVGISIGQEVELTTDPSYVAVPPGGTATVELT
ncbi:MAG: choice-of-anchor D domain-containing protein, partial [Myxococcota bacterium]|nr:choice-of-anchor D domain-containing protein [Myxococcota bacterium]